MWHMSKIFFRRDSLNAGSSMTLGSKGSKLSPEAHRRRMPWTASKEYIPHLVLNAKDKTIFDDTQLVEIDHIDRASQIDPLEVLKAVVSNYCYNTSTGKNIFHLAAQLPFHGRGQRFYRQEWKEGTYDKHITLSAIDFDRDGNRGIAYGYVTFHGESTTRPVQVSHADVPGWTLQYDESAAVPFDMPVPPPPSIGTDIPVCTQQYRLKAYPYYDVPNPPRFVERLLKDRGVLPDMPMYTNPQEDTDNIKNSTQDNMSNSMHHSVPSQE